MRYIGSKASTIEQVSAQLERIQPSGTLCDPFGGIGVAGTYFKRRGYRVWTGDILTFAHFFQVSRIEQSILPTFADLCNSTGIQGINGILDLLNVACQQDGWLIDEYAIRRRFFTLPNAQRIEGCRRLIADWLAAGYLSYYEHATLMASLIDSMDRVANTAGTYYAYLKKWYRKALQPFKFTLIQPGQGSQECRCFLGNAEDLVSQREYNVLYLDPPFNRRSYAHYYHLPESLALGISPMVKGLSGIPDVPLIKSAFTRPHHAASALNELLGKARFRLLVFHYSNSGIIRPDEVHSILSQFGRIHVYDVEGAGYTTSSSKRVSSQVLYLVTND